MVATRHRAPALGRLSGRFGGIVRVLAIPGVCHWLLFLFLPAALLAQKPPRSPFQYLSPVPNSSFVSPRTNVIVRYGATISRKSIRQDAVRVVGSLSGERIGRVSLSDDEKTILWTPAQPFEWGERVVVEIRDGFLTEAGEKVPPWSFTCTIAPPVPPGRWRAVMQSLRRPEMPPRVVPRQRSALAKPGRRTLAPLPPDFPAITVLANNAPEGDPVFLGSFDWLEIDSTAFLMILERSGDPLFYRKGAIGWGFTPQPNGTLTYFRLSSALFEALDSAYHVVGTYECGNGYPTDGHELRVMPNGHAFLLGRDWRIVGMDTVVEGGNPEALVLGNIIQELDRDGNVVFHWSTWDHFKITDAVEEDLTGAMIDPIHANSLDIDGEGNLLLSSRNIDEVTKINGATGEIIWRFGGKNNQFTFINDVNRFEHQHTARRLPNGHITIFDNGYYREWSRAVEYALNEADSTATLVWEYRHDPDIPGWSMGNTERLPNGNTFIGWGNATPALTEVTPGGQTVLEMAMPAEVYTYRAFSWPWKTNAFVPSTEDLSFPDTAVGDTISMDLAVTNPTAYDVTLTSFPTRTGIFRVTSPAPVLLPAHDKIQLRVTMAPATFGSSADTLDIRSEDSTQGIIRRMTLNGSSPVPTIGTSPSSLDFGSVAPDSIRQLVIANTSLNTLVIDSAYTTTRRFSLERSRLSVRTTDTLVISYTPPENGIATDTLYLHNNSITPLVAVPLRGAAPQSDLMLSATILDFGTVQRGDSSTLPVVARSATATPLTITGAAVTGKVFVPLLTTPLVVNPHDSISVPVRFRPAAAGIYTDTLVISSDGGVGKVTLRGEAKDPSTGISRDGTLIPSTFVFPQNYPNPFNGTTMITFGIPAPSRVSMTIYDVMGREVTMLARGESAAGYYRCEWHTGAIASGVYYCRFTAAPVNDATRQPFTLVKKLILMK